MERLGLLILSSSKMKRSTSSLDKQKGSISALKITSLRAFCLLTDNWGGLDETQSERLCSTQNVIKHS